MSQVGDRVGVGRRGRHVEHVKKIQPHSWKKLLSRTIAIIFTILRTDITDETYLR